MATNNKPIFQSHTFFLTMFVFLISMIVSSIKAPSPSDDVNALITFRESLKDDSKALASWNPAVTPCVGKKNNWAGLVCSRGGSVWGLKLENMGLSGDINVDALARLRKLRSISLMNNTFTGPMPDFRRLKTLKAIFLSNNQFNGPIDPNAFEGVRRLKKVHLANNKFSGEIPTSLIALKRLVELRLEGNQFEGSIPNLVSTMIQSFNVSNNQLRGPIPDSVAKFDPTAFAGNKDLCGGTLNPCDNAEINEEPIIPSSPPPPLPTYDKPIPIIAIVAGVVFAMIISVLIILMVIRNRYEKKDGGHKRSVHIPAATPTKKSAIALAKNNKENNQDNEGSHRCTESTSGKHNKSGENGKLTFIKEDRDRFDLPDLLKASAEILGSGSFGSTYKATFSNGTAVVVKRFKQMNNAGREEFQEHMRRLGRLSHPNLLPFVAYYYRKEEKLFITDAVQKGSLALLLHGQRVRTTLDWPTRLKIIKGMAKGLAYLYNELPCLVAPHGHLKSSNVLLTRFFEPVLGDYGLIPLINQESAQNLMVAYKSPEYLNNGRITKKTDVWALGILIIEILTGILPSPYLQQGSETDMGSWVESVISGGFDKNMGQLKNSGGEMQKLLNIGLDCCAVDVEKRLDINEACEKIQGLKEDDDVDFTVIID